MDRLFLDFREPSRRTCARGGPAAHLTRFVHRGETCIGMVYAYVADSMNPRIVPLLVSLGDWSTDDRFSARTAFAVESRRSDNGISSSFRDGSQSPWHGTPVAGDFLSREEALRHPLKPLVFRVLDLIWTQDQFLVRFLRGESVTDCLETLGIGGTTA